MRRAITTLVTLTLAALCCGAMSIGAKPTIHDIVLLGFINGPLRISGSGLRESTFPADHSVVFTGTPNVTIDACSPMPCVSGGARILSWTSSDIRFDYLPATITGGFTAAVTTPRGTSAAVSVEMYALTQFALPAPTDVNMTASTRLMVDGFEYGCANPEPCDMTGAEFSGGGQWTATTTSGGGTITNDYNATPWNGDTDNNWGMHTSGGTAYRYKTLGGSTKEISAHFEFCPQSLPAAARTVMAFRGGGTDQMFLTYGSDGILRSYYNTTSNVGPVTTALPVGTCYEVAALQDADTDTAGCARLSVYVDGTNAGDTSLCSLSITAADTFRLGAIDGTLDAVFDNVVLSSGVDESVIYLRLVDLHPTSDDTPNNWTLNGCVNHYDCVNQTATATSHDSNTTYLSNSTVNTEEEFGLTNVTLDDDPVERIASGAGVSLSCYWRDLSTSGTPLSRICLSDGTNTSCAASFGFGSTSGTYKLTPSALFTTTATGGTWAISGSAAPYTADSYDAMRLRFTNIDGANMRVTDCTAEAEVTKRLPSFDGSNPLLVAMAFDPATGDLYGSGEFSSRLFRLPASATDGAAFSPVTTGGGLKTPHPIFYFGGVTSSYVTTFSEDVDYFNNAGVGEIWFTQGGGAGYSTSTSTYNYNGSAVNASRVVRYTPSTGAWQCYLIPDDDATIVGVYVESASSVYVAAYQRGLYHFNPSTWSAAQTDCAWDISVSGYPAPACGSEPCWDSYSVTTPFDLQMVDGDVWMSNYWFSTAKEFDPATEAITTTVQFPESPLANRYNLGSLLGDLFDVKNGFGTTPQYGALTGTTWWVPEFWGGRVSAVDTVAGTSTQYDFGTRYQEYVHSAATSNGYVWVTLGNSNGQPIGYVWTGTDEAGAHTGNSCTISGSNSWTNGSAYFGGTPSGGSGGGTMGDMLGTDATWIESDDAACTAYRSLYCFEQGTASDRRVFRSSKWYTGNLGGLSGADAKCQALATDAGMGSSTWKAWLSSTATDASARLDHLGASYDYTLVNGEKVADGWTDLTDGTLDHAIDRDEYGDRGIGRLARIDTNVSPYTVALSPDISDMAGYENIGGLTGIETDASLNGHLCAAATVYDQSLKPIVCLQQQPPPATYTFTPTRTSTPTPTNTATPVYYENGILNLTFQSSNSTSSLYGASTQSSASTTEVRRSIWPPMSYRATDLYASCTSADASRSTTFTLRNDGADVSGAACTMTAGTTTCSATGFASDYSSNQELAIRSALSSSGGTARRCTVGVSYKANGGTGEADAVIFGGGDARSLTATSPTPTTYYCGTCKVNATCDAQYSCAGTTKLNAGLLIPKACTLSGLGIIADSGIGSGNTETYTIEKAGPNGTPSPTPDLQALIDNTGTQSRDTTCTVNCSVSAGDRLFLRNDVLGTTAGGNKYRRWAISCDGAGQFVVGGVTTVSTAAVYVGQNNSATASDVATRAPRAFTARSLHVQSVNALTGGAATVTLYKGSTAASLAATALTCTTVSNGTSFCPNGTHCCRDVTNNVSVAAGEFWVLRESAAGSTTNANLLMSFEQSNGN